MGKTKVISMILIGIFLVGCSENDAIEEVLPLEPTDEISSELVGPPTFHIVYSADSTINGTLDKYCWEKEETACTLEPTPPKERLQDKRPLGLKSGEKVGFIISTSDPLFPIELLTPDKIELIQTGKDEQSTFEVENKKFKAPEEKGDYYYSAILTWNGDQKGQAIYAFSLWVK